MNVDLMRNDNYAQGILLPVQKHWDEVVYAGLKFFQETTRAGQPRRDLPYACLAFTGAIRRDQTMDGLTRYGFTASRSVYPADQVTCLSVSRIPVSQLQKPGLPPADNLPIKPYRWNLAEQNGEERNGYVSFGGPNQARRPRHYRADSSPFQSLPSLSKERFEPSEQQPKLTLRSPLWGDLRHVVSQTKNGKPYHFDLILRLGTRDELIYRFDAQTLAKLGDKVTIRPEGPVPKDEWVVTVEGALEYARRLCEVYNNKLQLCPPIRRDHEEFVPVTDKPDYVEAVCRMLGPMIQLGRTIPGTPGRPTLVAFDSWAPRSMIELPWGPDEAFGHLKSAHLLFTPGLQRLLLSAASKGELSKLPSLPEQLREWVAAGECRAHTWNDLAIGFEVDIEAIVKAFIADRVLFAPGQYGYQGNGCLLDWEVAPPCLRRRASSRHLFFPTWAEHYCEDIGIFVAPPLYHEVWNEPPISGTLPDRHSRSEDFEDFAAIKRIAADDSWAWTAHGVVYSMLPARNTLVAKHLPRIVKKESQSEPRATTATTVAEREASFVIAGHKASNDAIADREASFSE